MTFVQFCLPRDQLPRFILFFNPNHFVLYFCLFVCFRSRPVGIHCVTCGRLCRAHAPGYWDFVALHQKKTTSQEVYYKSLFSVCVSLPFTHKIQVIITHRVCDYFFSRYFQSTSGQFNPVFRSSSTRGSPRIGTTHISQPIFVESSVTQACKPLTSAPARPHAVELKPSRAAPEASCSTRESSCHMTVPFLASIN